MVRKSSVSSRHLTVLQRAALRTRLRGLLDALAMAAEELSRLAALTTSSPHAYYDAFEHAFRDFECLNATVADYFARFPEEQKRFLLGENAEKLTFLAIKEFIVTSLHYYRAMDEREDLPFGIYDHFLWHFRKIEELEKTLQESDGHDDIKQIVSPYLDQARTQLKALMDRSTSLESFE